MLINNTSGLYPGTNTLSFDLSEKAIESFVENLRGTFLTREPGTTYEYSNTGFAVAGLIISRVSGRSYSEYLKENIFKPMGMSRASTDPRELLALNAIPGHYPSIASVIPADQESEFKGLEYTPAGSMLSASAEDIGNYLKTLLGEGRGEVISKDIINQLWAANITFPGLTKDDGGDGSTYSYGLGWMISTIEGRKIIHHGGSTGRTSSFTMIDPKKGIAASILMNVDLTFIDKLTYTPEFTIVNNIMRIASGLPESNFGIPLSNDVTKNNFDLKPSQLDRYTGTFKQQDGGDVWVYFGVTLRIDKTNTGGLEAILFRGRQIINRFNIDFLNEALAVSRNINAPSYLKFNISAQGYLSGLSFNGIAFSKNVGPGQTISLNEVQITFGLPLDWQVKTEKLNFSGKQNDLQEVHLVGGITDRKIPIDIQKIILLYLNADVKNTEKNVIKLVSGGLVWRQQTIDLRSGGKEIEAIILYTETSGLRFWLMLSAPKQCVTRNAQHTIQPILSTLTIK